MQEICQLQKEMGELKQRENKATGLMLVILKSSLLIFRYLSLSLGILLFEQHIKTQKNFGSVSDHYVVMINLLTN